jgi:hypothetical protein
VSSTSRTVIMNKSDCGSGRLGDRVTRRCRSGGGGGGNGDECSSDGDGVGWLMTPDEVSLDRHATHRRQVGLTVEKYHQPAIVVALTAVDRLPNIVFREQPKKP